MAPSTSPAGRELLKLLADGEWHPFDDIVAALGAIIAPGPALRKYERREANRQRIHGAPRVRPELSDDDKIASGRLVFASEAISSYKKRYVEIAQDPDGNRMLRRRADAPVSPLPCIDPAAAAPSTTPAPTTPTVAFFSEEQVRSIVATEVSDALDAFQNGMQRWLTDQFAGLETAMGHRPPDQQPRPPRQRRRHG